MGDDRKAEYEMAPTSDPENPDPPAEKAELGTEEDGSQQWSGLSKEELLRVADTPAWNWTRNILLILFWIAWVVMLIVAIILVVKAPSCPDVEWHEKSPIYQVYLRSFRDKDNDGYGDLGGLIAKVKTIKEDFNAETILLSPLFKQDNESTYFGQETVDFKDVDPSIGTLEEFKSLIEQVQVNGMHLILEFDPNHSSDQHEWFEKSRQAKEGEEYWDYYIWADEANDEWKNYKGESAWTLDDVRGQYYYHFYEESQPDLNFNSDNVKSEIKAIMEFWLDEMKVDGFVLANFDRLLEPPMVTVGRKKRQAEDMATDGTTVLPPDMMMTTSTPEMRNSTPKDGSPEPGATDGYPTQYESIGQATTELPEDVAKLLDDLNQVVYENSYLGKYRVLIPQHSGPVEQNILYRRENGQGFPMCLSFAQSLNDEITNYDISLQMETLTGEKDEAGNSVEKHGWAVGHSQISRLASRTGDNARALLMLMFSLPGTPMPYYGEELGLVDVDGENGWLGPYPWTGDANGGFSTNTSIEPWMPVAKDIQTVNLEAQKGTEEEENKDSDLAFFKNLSTLRKQPSLLAGVYEDVMVSTKLFAFTRHFEGWPRYLAVFNFGDDQEDKTVIDKAISGKVVLSASGKMMDEEVQLNKLTISGNDAFLIEYEEQA